MIPFGPETIAMVRRDSPDAAPRIRRRPVRPVVRRRRTPRPNGFALALNYSICRMLRGASFGAAGLAIVIGCATTEEYDPATFWVQVGAVAVLMFVMAPGLWRLADWAARCETRGGSKK